MGRHLKRILQQTESNSGCKNTPLNINSIMDRSSNASVGKAAGGHLQRILPMLIPTPQQDSLEGLQKVSQPLLQNGMNIKVIMYKQPAPQHLHTCKFCPGRCFTSKGLAEHESKMHKAKLRCTHCDFSCEVNECNVLRLHYRVVHCIVKEGDDIYKKHQVPVSIVEYQTVLLDFGLINGLQELPAFVVEENQRNKKTKALCIKKIQKTKKSEKEDFIEFQLQTEEVRDTASYWNVDDPTDGSTNDFSKWLPFFVSQESLLPLPAPYSEGLPAPKSKPAVMEKTRLGNFIRSRDTTTAAEEVPESVKFLSKKYGDHHVFQYLTHSERTKKLKCLIKDTGLSLADEGLANLVDSFSLTREGSNNGPYSDDECVLLQRYGCVLCDFEALTPEAVKNHWVNYHIPKLPYQCVHCRMFSSDTKTLLNHIGQMHPGSRIAFWVKTSEDYLFQLQVETDNFAPMFSDEDFRQASCQPVGLYKQNQDNWVMTAIGYKVFNKWYCCHLCSYRAIHVSALIKHSKMCILPQDFLKGSRVYYMCEFCKKWIKGGKSDLIRHESDSACTPFVNNRNRVISEVEALAKNKKEEIDKLSKFQITGNKDCKRSPVNLDWYNVSRICLIGDTAYFACRSCSFLSTSKADTLVHVMTIHKWPTSFCCSCGIVCVVYEKARKLMTLNCASCNTEYDMKQLGEGLNMEELPQKQKKEEAKPIILRCRLCNYLSTDKNTAVRHMSKHAETMVYKCSKCGFMDPRAAVVKDHIVNLHRNCTDIYFTHEGVDKSIHDRLFEELDQIEGMTRETTVVYPPDWKLWLDSQDTEQSFIQKLKVVKPSSGWTRSRTFQCYDCGYREKDWEKYLHHTDVIHGRTAKELKRNMQKAFNCVHYQCLACLYRCIDRSCMSRHVKYMHLQRFAHCCPYCNYGSVEKSKVRYHVLNHHHQMSDAGVTTDPKILYEMQEDVKDYFVKVDPENQKIIPPKRKRTKVSTDAKHLRKGGPRAKALEVLLQQRKERSKTTSELDSLDYDDLTKKSFIDEISKKSFAELKNITMLTVEAEKQMAYIDTPGGILSVDFHGYVPKVEVLDSVPLLKEGEDYEAYEVKWEQESNWESDHSSNDGENISGNRDQQGKGEGHSGIPSDPGGNSDTKETVKASHHQDVLHWVHGQSNTSSSSGVNIESIDSLAEDHALHEKSVSECSSTSDHNSNSAVCIGKADSLAEGPAGDEKSVGECSTSLDHITNTNVYIDRPDSMDDGHGVCDDLLGVKGLSSHGVIDLVIEPDKHPQSSSERHIHSSAVKNVPEIIIKPEVDESRQEVKSPNVVRPIMVIKNQCVFQGSPTGVSEQDQSHSEDEDGVDTDNSRRTVHNKELATHKRPYEGYCSFGPPLKLKRNERQFVVKNNINLPSVHKLLVKQPLLSVRTSVPLTDIMKHLLHLK